MEVKQKVHGKQSQKDAKAQAKRIKEVAAQNRANHKKGHVICTRMRMMTNPPDHDGYLKVFPNYKHQHRTDGFGCASLSPKSIGPINHPQPGLPPAQNLENFWQFSKVFPDEVDSDGEPSALFFQRQVKGFLDPVPHRHKSLKTPLYSVWRRQDQTLIKYKYVPSRQFYCHYYERFALVDDNFLKLKQMIADGFQLQICGYDAYPVTKPLMEHYLDESAPFGHELVLYTLLTANDPEEYPWRKFKTEEF